MLSTRWRWFEESGKLYGAASAEGWLAYGIEILLGEDDEESVRGPAGGPVGVGSDGDGRRGYAEERRPANGEGDGRRRQATDVEDGLCRRGERAVVERGGGEHAEAGLRVNRKEAVGRRNDFARGDEPGGPYGVARGGDGAAGGREPAAPGRRTGRVRKNAAPWASTRLEGCGESGLRDGARQQQHDKPEPRGERGSEDAGGRVRDLRIVGIHDERGNRHGRGRRSYGGRHPGRGAVPAGHYAANV